MKQPEISWVFTVEHASKAFPRWFLCTPSEEMHTLFDIGAKEYACDLKDILGGKLFLARYSRLLVDLNRSKTHPKIFSKESQKLALSKKKSIIDKIYDPFRKKVYDHIFQEIQKGKHVIHMSCHSFVHGLHGVERNIDLGILYDPRKKCEKKIAHFLQKRLLERTSMRVRLNKPYRGVSDGHTTHLRRKFSSEKYSGIEVEVNQRLFSEEFLSLWKHVWFPAFATALLATEGVLCH